MNSETFKLNFLDCLNDDALTTWTSRLMDVLLIKWNTLSFLVCVLTKSWTGRSTSPIFMEKVSRGLGVILKARQLLPQITLEILYFSLIYPIFTYCNQVWGNACDTHLHLLVLLHKRCMRIITRSKYRDHTDPLFKKLGLLKMDQINKYFISKCMHVQMVSW